jgi:hypothetical protein
VPEWVILQTTGEWLDGLGLGRYGEIFEENDLDLDLVIDLSDDDLEKLGIASMGHRKKSAARHCRPGRQFGR